ncbi:MAG: choice-of-anchor J domain-containing protein, partial [Candidatus Cloacimonadota bacterium]|nr:choice-of-anchor J domain-containing protein [Candidatus Cloacimonadota bacterium]
MKKGILILLVSLLLVTVAWAAPEKTREPGHTPVPQERLDASEEGLTFQVRGDRAQDITIELTVDSYPSEASWNLWSYAEGAYYYAEDQVFTTGNETVTETLTLDEGDYSVDCFDSYGDGGIAGTVYDAEDNVLVTWEDDAYDSFGEFPFTVAIPPFEFAENFDDGIPAEWEVIGDPSWVGVTEYGYSASTLDGTPFAMIDSDDAGSGINVVGELITPAIDVTGYDSILLEFDQYYSNIATSEDVNVQVWDGAEWQIVAQFTDDMGSWSNPDHQVIDLSAYVNSELKVKFYYDDGDNWAWYWAVDNVRVFNPVAGTLEGFVYAYGTTNPIEGATVTCGDVSATTDATGFYTLEVNAGSYDAVADAENYFEAVESVEILTEEVTTQDFELTWAEIAVTPSEVNVELPGGLTEQATLTISNPGGTAPLTYNANFTPMSKKTITLKETKERGEDRSGFSKTEQITVPENRATGWYYYTTIDDMTSLTWAAPERATFFQMADFAIPYPVEITNLSHWFYEHPSYPWDNDQFRFKVYAADGTTLLYESEDLTAQHLVEYNYALDEPLVVEDDFWVAIAPISDSGHPSSVGTNMYDGHSYVWNPDTGEWELYPDLEYTIAVGLSQWMTISNATGTVEPGGSAEVVLNFDAEGLENVTKTGEIFIQNDAYYPMGKGADYIVPVTMEVGPAVPIFEFDYTTTDFGSIPIGATEGPETYGIQNVGSGTFVVEELTITGDNQDEFILDDLHEYPLEIQPGERINVDVTFAPNSIGDKQAYLFVVNDIGREVEVLEFTGNAYVPDLPGAPSNPTPEIGVGDVSVETGLSWENGEETVAIDLYLDTVNPPQNKVLDNVSAVENYDPGTLDFDTTYYWKVVARNVTGETQGATWFFMTSESGTGPMTFLDENFDEGIPAEWEITGDVAPWHGVTDYNGDDLDGTPFAFVDSDEAGSGGVHVNTDLITPPLDTTAGLSVNLEFDHYYNYISTSEVVNVQVWDGSEWHIVLELTEDMGDWGAPDHQEIDISDYSNQELKVKFHYDDGTSWAWYWAVDNVKVNSGAQIPVFTITPDEHDFGSIPVYTWQTQEFVITNSGVNDLIVQDLSVTGPNTEYYELADDNEYPVTIAPEDEGITVEVTYAPMAEGDHSAFLGVYTGEDAENQHVIDISGSAYLLPVGDIVGNPYMVEFTDGLYSDTGTNDGFEDNYDLPASDGPDVVYQFTLEEDVYMDSISLYGSDFDTKMAVYADGVVPGDDNYLYYNDDRALQSALYDIPLFAGTYNIVIDGYGGAVGNYELNMSIGDSLPAPVAATNPNPEDGAVEVPADGTVLSWEIGEFTKYVDVYFGTTYPPELVVEDGDMLTEYNPGTLDPNQIYFWKIVSKNSSGAAESNLWAFTSSLTPPTELAAEVIDYVDVELTWEGPTGGGGGGGGGSGDEFFEDFEAGMPSDWTVIDADGDSYNWEWSGSFTAHSGVGIMYSASYLNTAGALTPDNYLITPQVEIGDNSEFSFWYVAQDPVWPGDKAYIKVSTTDTNPASFTEELGFVEAGATYTQATFDMSDFSGETVYIALEHTDCTDFFYINVDDVSLTNASKVNNTDVTYNTEATSVDPLKNARLTEAAFEAKLAAYTAGNDREFTGYNVYRDGELVAENIPETSYYDESVAVGTHTYAVSAIYHEGESATCDPVEAIIPGIGMIYGTVIDDHSGASIIDAEITAVNVEDEELVYTATTNIQGEYEIPEMLEGTYNVTCHKDGYPDEAEMDVYVGHEDEVELNFTPNNFGLPPTLTAQSGVDEAVPLHVSPWGGIEEYTQAFHDGGFESQLGCG